MAQESVPSAVVSLPGLHPVDEISVPQIPRQLVLVLNRSLGVGWLGDGGETPERVVAVGGGVPVVVG